MDQDKYHLEEICRLQSRPDIKEIKESIKSMILSASGWRKIFASDEESRDPRISDSNKVLAAGMGKVFSDFIKKRITDKKPTLAVGTDSRFTGAVISDMVIRLLLKNNINVKFLGIIAAPEIMCYAGEVSEIDGFIYISASHNPIGHNGVKFGLSSGGVINAKESAELINDYKVLLNDSNQVNELIEGIISDDPVEREKVYTLQKKNKSTSYQTYLDFTKKLSAGKDNSKEAEVFKKDLFNKIDKNPLGIIAELNGSARGLSIDQEFFNSLGIDNRFFNSSPGEIVHRIVPEGASLNLCKDLLFTEWTKDKRFCIGYVPDCDGDRGNVVYVNEKTQKAEILEAQEVFALSVLSELADLSRKGFDMSKTAIAINGPTSMRIDRIAEAFGTKVYRAEVGEANVVGLANELRSKGKMVRILGEGSNGGNITYPASVRDPLNTIIALVKLLRITSEEGKPGLFELWCKASHQDSLYNNNFTLNDILASLPAFITTSAYEDRAIMRISSSSQAALKKKYEMVFLKEWETKKDELRSKYNIESWKEINTEGSEEKQGFGPNFRSGTEKGGLKIVFMNKTGNAQDYIWMRGSGTEPVFRVLVDSMGEDLEKEAFLLTWHRSMIERADKNAVL